MMNRTSKLIIDNISLETGEVNYVSEIEVFTIKIGKKYILI